MVSTNSSFKFKVHCECVTATNKKEKKTTTDIIYVNSLNEIDYCDRIFILHSNVLMLSLAEKKLIKKSMLH